MSKPQKIVNVCVSDTGASAYNLSHALNKLPNVSSLSLRTSNSWVNYPCMAESKYYGKDGCRKIIESADAVVFHSNVRAFYQAFGLDPAVMKEKKKFLYFHGSEARHWGPALLGDAKELMGEFTSLVATPDLLTLIPDSVWLPVARDFTALQRKYSLEPRDLTAMKQWGAFQRNTVVAHAPTNMDLKGSPVFYKIITELLDATPKTSFLSIKDVPWDTCMRMLSTVNVLYDQFLLGGYGMISVEASAFNVAVFCKLASDVCAVMEKESDLRQPFIQWADEDELRTQSFMLVQDHKLQRQFGKMANAYCKKMHDSPNVAQRFMKILDKAV